MLRLSVSSEAVKVSMPLAFARRHRRLSSTLPSPRPCQSSITVTVASAVAGRSGSRR